MINRLNSKAILFVIGLASFNGVYLTPVSGGETHESQVAPAKPFSEHLTGYDQTLTNLVQSILRVDDNRTKRSKATEARTFLVSIPDPDSRFLWEAAILSAQTDFEGAGEVLSKVKNFEQGTYLTLKLAARTEARLMRSEAALKLCSLALKKGKDEELVTLQAVCYLAQKKYGEAASKYAEAATMGYKAANNCRAASCFLRNNQPDKGLEYAEKSFQGATVADLPSCYTTQGICLEHLNRLPDAVVAFTKALDLYVKQGKQSEQQMPPDRSIVVSNCLNERANCYDKLGKAVEAKRDRKQGEFFAKNVEMELFGK